MKKLVLLIVTLVTLSLAASAGIVNIQFTGPAGPSYGGEYTYPYVGSVNGSPEWLMCTCYNEHIFGGETWNALALTVSQYGAIVGLSKAEEIAYVYTLAVADDGSNPIKNVVAWNLLEGVPSIAGDPAATLLYTEVVGMTFTAGQFADVTVYLPIGSNNGDVPQTLLGTTPTPEPGTLLSLGSGLVLIAAYARRKLVTL